MRQRLHSARRIRWCFAFVSTVVLAALCLDGFAPVTWSAEPDLYADQIKPLLAKRCYACHGALKQQAGLRLDTVASARRGGDSGPAINPDQAPDDNLLIRALTGQAGFTMPPEGEGTRLNEQEIQLVRRWLAAGARAQANEQPQENPRDFWSYQPPRRHSSPSLRDSTWPRGPIDVWVAKEHEQRKLTRVADAAPEVWLRRVYLDLIGLPPTPEELHEFLADAAPDARARLVDRLLARPQHGERWGRHWMDVWRYSDWYGSRGINEIRYSQRHIWRWRDWIVNSVNQDKSYARMVAEMLAGDELAPTDPEVLSATGFLGRNWYKFDRNVWMFETIEQTSQAFLGMTLRCARCHDHKFDPITQEEYYRFRAFFEPHDVRTDRLSASTKTEKDATLGEVPTEGVARVYDKQLSVPTYLFQRGDSRYPEEKKPLTPGVPAIFATSPIVVEPVSLPPFAYYPQLQPALRNGLLEQARAAVRQQSDLLVAEQKKLSAATRELEQAMARGDGAKPGETKDGGAAPAPGSDAGAKAALERASPAARALADLAAARVVLADDFARAVPDRWSAVGGQWQFEQGKLVQKQLSSFATYVAKGSLPTEVYLRVRYRTLAPGSLRSIGFSYDYIDQGNSQDVYTSTGDAAQSIQAFHRLNGRQEYPQAGIVKTPLKVGDELSVEAIVRGSRLILLLNGERKLDYVLPAPRRSGAFALWAHDGSAEFLEVEIRHLQPTLADHQRAVRAARNAVARTELHQETVQAELTALDARIAAELAQHGVAPASATPATATPQDLALAASRAERAVQVAKDKEELRKAEQFVAELRAEATPQEAALLAAEQKHEAARATLAKSEAAVAQPDGKYAPLGELFPSLSTGRRLALAKWITTADHPRTSRIAVNHVWLRHFGQALVPSVANFGLQGERPSHAELLDELALDLVRHDWEFKPLHRDLVLSATYQLASGEHASHADTIAVNHREDPTNRWLWRGHPRRMEAEVIRDSILHLAGSLDRSRGGPEIPETQGMTSPRRSLYFRATPNEKMKFLDLFDAADPNACYRRRESVVPQQALALMNSGLALEQARQLAGDISRQVASQPDARAPVAASDLAATDAQFIQAAFERVLARRPTEEEQTLCREFLAQHATLLAHPATATFPGATAARQPAAATPAQRARENLIHVLFSHNEFVTVR